MLSLIDKAPKELAGDIALIDGILYCSDARRGDGVSAQIAGAMRKLAGEGLRKRHNQSSR